MNKDKKVEKKKEDKRNMYEIKNPEELIPRKNKNAYMFFNQENLPKVKKEHPEWTNKTILGHLTKLWNDLKEDEKKKYIDLSAKDKERYTREMENMGFEDKPGKKKKSEEIEESKIKY
jgi:hypothetical protein